MVGPWGPTPTISSRTAERQQEGGGDGGDALAAAGEAEAVGGGGGDGDGSAGGLAQRALRLGAASPETRTLADHLDRHVPDGVPGRADADGGLGEEGSAGRAGPGGVGGAELRAQVAQPRGGQQRVAGRVRGDVSVGVTLEAVVLVGPRQ